LSEVSSLVVNIMTDSVMTAPPGIKVASVSRGRFEHELA
jgi:hypothetical protein